MSSTEQPHGASQASDLTIALAPCDLESVPEHIRKIDQLGAQLTGGEPGARMSLLKSARDLVRALETPRETMIKHCWAQPAAFSSIELGLKVGLFEALSRDNGSSKKKAADLALQVGVDPPIAARLLRHLGAMGYITETGPDEYKPTNFSTSLNIPEIGDGYPLITASPRKPLDKLPEYLEKTGWKNPNSATAGPFQYGHNTDMNLFEYLQANPPNYERFHHHMGGYRQGRDSWMDAGFFPVQERLIDGADSHEGAVFLVDIGGSFGHDIQEFHRNHPNAPGRLILQDLPSVIEKIRHLDERIESMAYDFYKEQPVKGSRAYFMHSVLHDWPDDICLDILARITEAMRPGYSKLLIHENVIPATGADWQATAGDLMMMAMLASSERTEGDWRVLLDRGGLGVCNIWRTENALESLIECVLA